MHCSEPSSARMVNVSPGFTCTRITCTQREREKEREREREREKEKEITLLESKNLIEKKKSDGIKGKKGCHT